MTQLDVNSGTFYLCKRLQLAEQAILNMNQEYDLETTNVRFSSFISGRNQPHADASTTEILCTFNIRRAKTSCRHSKQMA
jgi:hypothetical protein